LSIYPPIRLSAPADRDAILAFITRMGFNPRDAVTWDGLNMLAMTAWDRNRLIGAIPFEPRELKIASDRTIRTLHETVVAVDEAHRGGGLGSRMQTAIAEQRPADAELITVFREDPQSPAYRWYIKNGFFPAIHIESWFCDEPIALGDPAQIWKATDPAAPWPAFEIARPPGRTIRNLQKWLAVHPYRKQYSFWIVRDELGSVALLGVGKMHSETVRADVLDFVAPDDAARESLLWAIISAAEEHEWHPVRLPLASDDPTAAVALSVGFKPGWPFDMLVKSLSPIDTAGWRYAGIDYA